MVWVGLVFVRGRSGDRICAGHLVHFRPLAATATPGAAPCGGAPKEKEGGNPAEVIASVSSAKPERRRPFAPFGAGRRSWFARRDEDGLVLVWTSMFIVVLFGFASLAVDIGRGTYVSERARDATDAVPLAGAPYLPGNLAGAQSAAQSVAATNGFTNGVNGVTVTARPGAKGAAAPTNRSCLTTR